MADMLLRIILASYLAIWSPAMCCCAVKSALGAATQMDVRGCHGSDAMPAEVSKPAAGACCSHQPQRDDAATIVAVSAHSEDRPQGDEPAPCRCHEPVESKVRLDTGAKVVVPALLHIDPLTAIAPSMVALTETATGEASNSSGAPARADPPPPRTTLLAQRTLLLI